MELLGIKLAVGRDNLQNIQDLIPLCRLSFNRNLYGLRRRLRVRYCDEYLPLEESIFFDARDIDCPMDWAKD